MFSDSSQHALSPVLKQKTTTDNVFSKALQELKSSGIYWNNLSREESELKLAFCKAGYFLIRDSSASSCIFTLSLKGNRKVLHIRIIYCNGRFSLESEYQEREQTFESIVNMLDHYIGKAKIGPSITLVSRKGRKTHVKLLTPLRHCCPSLKHLCRVKINNSSAGCMDVRELEQFLPHEMRQYCKEYPFKI